MQHPRALASASPRSNNVAFPAGFCSCGPWVESLLRSDVNRLWLELRRVVSNHHLVRASRNAGLIVEEGDRQSAYTDLTQELFVILLSKARFQHYLDSKMSDAEIECEISQIELTNLLTAELRKRHPESYRLARRISTIIQSSANFRRFDTTDGPREQQHRRLVDHVYGLSEWRDDKARRTPSELEQRVRLIPVWQRDTQLVGCTGDAQIIISNADLEGLIVSVLEACDAPVDVRSLRSLVMSRLPVMDIYLVPLSGEWGEEGGRGFEPVDGRENPEQTLLRREAERGAAAYVDHFLKGLHAAVRGKAKQYDRMLGVLWLCYLSPDHVTQLEAAARLKVSDTLVSDYRRRIEQQLRALSFRELEEARRFEIALRERIRTLRLRPSPTARGSLGKKQEAECTMKKTIHVAIALLVIGVTLLATAETNAYQSRSRKRERNNAATAYYNQGVKHVLSGRNEEAVKAFKQAIQLEPEEGDAYFSLGKAYADLGRWDEAVEAYRQAIRLSPKDGEAYNNLGLAYFQLGLYGRAFDAFTEAIRIHPKWAEPHYNLSNVQRKLGRPDAADASYRQAVLLRPDLAARPPLSPAPKGPQTNDPQQRGNDVARMVSTPRVADERREEKRAAAPTGRRSPRASAVERTERLNPTDSRALYNLGVRHGRAKRYEEAVTAFRQAIQSNPNYADAYFGLGQAYSYLGRWKEAAEAYEQVLRLDPKDDDAYYKLGEAYIKSRTQATPPNGNGAVGDSETAVGERVGAALPEPLTSSPATPTETAKEAPPKEVKTASGGTPETNEPAPPNVVPVRSAPEPKPVAASAPTTAAVDPTSVYRVGLGDVLDIRLLNAPTNESTLFTITSGGLLEYPLAGRPLRVAGLTTDEIGALIASELRHRAINENPQVVVGVREYASHNVIISGLVSEPGTKVLRREAVPLYVIVADAQPRAEAGQVTIVSRATGQRTTVDLSDQAAMSSLVYPGDVLTVGARGQQFFYIGGQVNSPGQKSFHPGMTLTQAILASGGELTRIGTVKIMRQGANGRLTTVTHNLKEILSGKAPDPVLQPNDRIGVAP